MAKPPAKTWGFLSLPAEIRLQILANTHLGPPSTGDYDPRLSILQVKDGRIVPRKRPPCVLTDDPEPWTKCTSPRTHGTTQPECQCRILPTQLFTVSRQTSAEALEVFYTNLHLDLDPDPTSATLLRSISPQSIHRLRRLTFTMMPVQMEGWCDGALASGYHGQLESIARCSWGGGPAKPPGDDEFYRRGWREAIAVLAAHADLPRLALTVDMCGASHEFFEDAVLWDELYPTEEILPWFRFLYDAYIDVATALCELRGLGALVIEVGIFNQMKPWLEREVLGREPPEPDFKNSPNEEHSRRRWEQLWRRPVWYEVIPPWHDVERRLEGSNYRPN